jgi:ribonuclease HI
MTDAPANEVVIYADGAASPNPGPGGYGVILIRDGRRQELSGGFKMTTNNRMEILGAIIGLRQLNGVKSQVTIYSDSRYLVDMFMGGYAAKWRQDHWTRNRGKDQALNPDLWNELLNLSAGHAVKFVWVRGHADHPENTRCDELAVLARQGKSLPSDDGYELAACPGQARQMTLFDLPPAGVLRPEGH